MALTRKAVTEWLSAAGTPEEKIGAVVDQIFAGHSSTVDALKEERDNYKANAEKLGELQSELDKAKLSIKDGEGWKEKYEAAIKERTTSAKRSALAAALKNAKANDAVIELMLETADLEKIMIGEDGKLADEETAVKPFRDKYAGLFGTVETNPAQQPKEPKSGGGQDINDLDDAAYYAAVMKKGN